MSEILPVKSPDFSSYQIHLEESWDSLAGGLSDLGLPFRRICLVTDSQVAPLYETSVRQALRNLDVEIFSFQFPAGEENKTLDQIQKLYGFLIEHAFDRHDMLASLGGGVVGDMTGFAAATYLRGIDFIQIPTTLLSQVDSSIGGKTGVDFSCYKNMVGAFKQPRMVYINLSVLATLPPRQISSGMAEVIKHGCIQSREYFSRLNTLVSDVSSFRPDAMTYLVRESLKIKRAIVEADPFEKGERALLNFGHTLGHALEKESGFSLSHGESVALGSVAAGWISCQKGFLSQKDLAEMETLFSAYGLPVRYKNFNADAVLSAVRHDKKMAGSTLRFILLNPLGRAQIHNTVSLDDMRGALSYLSKEI